MRLILSFHFWAIQFFAAIRLYSTVINAEKKKWLVPLLLMAFVLPTIAADFTPGNIVVLRVGTGTGNLVNTGVAVFLDEYTPAGGLVQSIALPTVVDGTNKRLILSGTATTEGMITRSGDGKYIMVIGYDAAIPTASLTSSASTTVNRVVARIDATGAINTTTALTDASTGSSPRGVTSTNGTDIWVTGGAGGVRYATLGGTTSTQLSTTATNLRGVDVFGGQLYISSGSGTIRVASVGSGTPTTSGQTITNVPGFATTGSPYGFFFADLDSGVAGVDVLYVADDDSPALTKYSLVGGNWVSNGTIGGTSDDYRGVTGAVNGSTVTLYATRKGGVTTTGGGELVTLTDASGYNGTFTGTPTVLATAATNTAFRGVVFAPGTALPTVNLSVSANAGTEAGTTVITVTATASSAVSGNQTVSLAVSGTSITAGDYTLSNNTITILNGQTTGSVTFTVTDDALAEGVETAVLTISNPSSGIALGSTVSQNINITDNDLAAGITVTESEGTTNTVEGGATDTYTMVLNTQPSANVTVTINAGTQVTTSLTSLTFTTSDWNIPQVITVTAINDGIPESSPHTGTITHTAASSDAAYNAVSVASVTVNITDELPPTKISVVQGSGSTSSMVGQTVTIRGIVVGDFETTLSGIYVQEENADADADPATSEGIFVFKNTTSNDFAVGDLVTVTGTVAEFTSSFDGNTSSLTQINNPTIFKSSSGNPLPTPATVQLPIANVSDFERYEGMSVTLSAASGNLSVTDNFVLGRFGQLTLSASGGNNEAGTDARLDQFTQFNAPSVSGYAASLAANARRSIILDDASTVQNPDPVIFGRGGNALSATNTLRTGDQVASVSGIFDHRFEGYRVQTLTSPNFIAANARPVTPPSVGASTLKVASFNILNYFNGNGAGGGFPTSRGAETTTEFTRQRDKIINAIVSSGADVIGLMELENDGYTSTSAIQDLVNGLNSATSAGMYDFVNPGGSISSDEITVGILYKPGKVDMVGAAAAIPFNYGTGSFTVVGRRSLAQTIKQKSNNAVFTLVVNHFKSKGSSSGGSGDADINDGQGFSNGTRSRQAKDIVAWLATKPTGTNDPDYLIVGDLNAYAKEQPLDTLAKGGYQNLLADTTYSYSFDGAFGALDHALAVSSLASQVTGATKWHINADEPIILDYNTNFKSAGQITSFYSNNAFRASDHDPILVGLNLCATSTVALSSPSVTDTQTVCINTPIVNITYTIGGTGANVSGLPSGVTSSFSNGVLTISGIPTQGGTFQYTVTSVGGCSPNATATGLLQINSPANASLTVTAPITSGTVTLVAGTITATNQVSGATVEYRATQYVSLQPGFSAVGNSFLARIGGCN